MTTIKTSGGLVQHANSIDELLTHLNRNGQLYEVRNGNEIWHKGHRTLYGVVA
jgi:hypothetical protein